MNRVTIDARWWLVEPAPLKLSGMARIFAFLGLIALLPACGTQSISHGTSTANVNYKMIVPNGVPRYELASGESAVQPRLTRQTDPEYPPALSSSAPTSPVEVVARLIVDASGQVHDIIIQPYSGNNIGRGPFNDAVRKAAMQWTFTPLRITQRVAHDIGPPTLETTAHPFSLWYMFRFEIVNGRPKTSISMQ